MRITSALAIGLAALVAGCATSKPPAQKSAAVSQDWILIAPPDNVVTVAFVEQFEFLPDHRDRFPGHANGLSEPDRHRLRELFEQITAQPSPAARVDTLTAASVHSDAPVADWRRVRVFRSAGDCEATRAELIAVTREQTVKYAPYTGMPREEFQWPLLARSYEFSRCVPSELATRHTARS